jgi:hypothetical protein
MTEKSRWLSAVGVLIAAFATVPAQAQPADPPGKSAEKSAKAAENAENKAAKAEAKAEAKAARADTKAEKAEERADRKADDKPGKADEKGEHGRPGHMPGTDPQPGHGADRHSHRGYRALGHDFREGKVTKAELKDRIAAMRANTNERRKEHREGLKKRWGATLAHPACREELRHHARREAFLSRAQFLAQTEVAKDKDKLLERIQKLIDKEEERHAKAMERLKSMPATAAPTAAAPEAAPAKTPLPTPTPAAPAKAGEK